MPPDATDTRRRILQAAVAEFAEFGLAGARVDRIAAAAGANKRSIYMHFGAKEELFDLVVGNSLVDLAEAVTFDAADLPGYAGALFDMLQDRPDIIRLTNWALLERPQPLPPEVDSYRTKLHAVAAAQQAGAITSHIPPVDLLAMLIALVTSWARSSPSLRHLAKRPESAARAKEHRASLVAAVAAIVTA